MKGLYAYPLTDEAYKLIFQAIGQEAEESQCMLRCPDGEPRNLVEVSIDIVARLIVEQRYTDWYRYFVSVDGNPLVELFFQKDESDVRRVFVGTEPPCRPTLGTRLATIITSGHVHAYPGHCEVLEEVIRRTRSDSQTSMRLDRDVWDKPYPPDPRLKRGSEIGPPARRHALRKAHLPPNAHGHKK